MVWAGTDIKGPPVPTLCCHTFHQTGLFRAPSNPSNIQSKPAFLQFKTILPCPITVCPCEKALST